MNKFRPEENALLIWNPSQARTAYISGEELAALKQWAENAEAIGTTGFRRGGNLPPAQAIAANTQENPATPNPFAERLISLGLITQNDKPAIIKAIKLAETKKPLHNAFSAPESLHIELTSHCPINCPQCYKYGPKTDLSLKFLLDTIRQAGEMEVFQIALGGGEPLIYPHIETVIKEIHSHGMASSITTSGAGLTSNLLTTLTKAGLNHVQISLNGSINEIHAKSRDGFEHGVAALSLLQHTNLSYGINWVARMDNIDDFPALVDLAKAYKAQNINILRYKPSPNESYPTIALSPEKTLLLEKMIKAAKGINLKLDSAFSHLRCKISGRTSFMSGCGAGRRFLALDSTGAYRPCSHVAMKEKSPSLRYTWYYSINLVMFRSLGLLITEPCKNCTYLPSCYGCRAAILGQGDDFYAGDKTCINIK
ncbi:MAG: radical SAM protein [Defluviitaleaceae bacterium]|nr:radical SAM protein [Defluviitaleaceae bacterium]